MAQGPDRIGKGHRAAMTTVNVLFAIIAFLHTHLENDSCGGGGCTCAGAPGVPEPGAVPTPSSRPTPPLDAPLPPSAAASPDACCSLSSAADSASSAAAARRRWRTHAA